MRFNRHGFLHVIAMIRQGHTRGSGLLPVLVLILSMAGCAHLEPEASLDESMVFDDHGLFGTRPELTSADGIFQLAEDQQREFLGYFHSPDNREVPAHRRVYDYLHQMLAGFSYRDETYTAADTARHSGGNCLSLAILTTALARLAGVDIGYQLIADIPVYQQNGQVIFKGVHVRSLLYNTVTEANKSVRKIEGRAVQQTSYALDRSVLKIDYFPSGNERFIKYIPAPEFTAMYYRNMAAEAIAAGDYSRAFWLTRAALKLEPDSAEAVNMMAVIYHRAGDDVRAEQIYNFGINHTSDQLSLLKNYRILLVEQGRLDEADSISGRIARFDDPSPFPMIVRADTAYNNGDYSSAIRYYKNATVLAPYLHEGYFGLARSYYQLGNMDAAERNLQNAVEHAFNAGTRSLYQAKLTVLARERQQQGP